MLCIGKGWRNITKGEVAVNFFRLSLKEIDVTWLGSEENERASSGTTKIRGGVGNFQSIERSVTK